MIYPIVFQDVSSTNTSIPDTTTVDSIPTPVAKPQNQPQALREVVTGIITSAQNMSDAQRNILPGMLALNAPMIA